MQWFMRRWSIVRGTGRTLVPAVLAAFAFICPVKSRAQPTVRVAKSYEDTVRILVITNMTASGGGNCSPATIPVGPKTLDFVKQSLAGVPNVKYGDARSTTWATVTAAFAPKMPHVIVHINAGFYSESGGMDAILDQAANQLIGVVSIGDDAAAFAGNVFGFKNISNADPVMDDGIKFSKLWVELTPKSDTLQDPGIVRNTATALGVDTVFFKPFGTDPNGDFRCQEDADTYNVDPAYARNVSFLGFQGAQDNGKPVGTPHQWQVITAFQSLQRRGVALSYQPQFMANAKAAHQIDYDAIMFASFAHAYKDPKFSFTDEAGNNLSGSDYWSPAKGKLYLTYTDDYVSADLSKTFNLSIRNRRGSALPDSETITVQAHVKQAGEKGVWKAEIPLAELRSPTKLNGTAEALVLGEITATVAAHDDVGRPDGTIATATLKVAYPDQAATVKIQDAANPVSAVGRFTSSIVIQIQDQSISKFADDTIWAQAVCATSGDKIAKLALVEKTPGAYASAAIPKNEGTAVTTDAALSCQSSDKIVVTYTDEVYGTTATAEAPWVVDNSAVMNFTALDSTTAITSAKDCAGANAFLVVVKGPTPTIGAADVLTLTLTTGSTPADVETVQLKETTATSGIFVSAPIRFAFSAAATSANGKVEAIPNAGAPLSAVNLRGEAVLGGLSLKKDLQLLPSAGTLQFTSMDTSDVITGVKDGLGGNTFRIVVRGATPSSSVDELTVSITTGTDAESIKLTETSATSGIFISQPIHFAFTTTVASGNGAVDAVPDPADTAGSMVAKAQVVLNGVTLKQDLLLQQAANLIKLAYIKDLDGDGAGDHVYFVFTRPLLTLPSSIGPVYWNTESAASANAQAPKLGYVTGSGQTIIDADFSGAPFPAGLTSIPTGANPHAVFPQDKIFEGQEPAIADSMGPVVIRATIAPYDGEAVAAGMSLDTLHVTVSEPLKPADWSALIRFGKPKEGACSDYAGASPVVPAGAPVPDAQGLTYTVLVANDQGAATPFTGDCIFLNADGKYADALGNPAPQHGVKVEGPKARKVRVALQGYPPVAGSAPGNPSLGGPTWIPPVGFVPGVTYKEPILPLPGSASAGTDAVGAQPLPAGLATVRVVTNRKYVGHIVLFDNLGNYVTEFFQSFGYRGELANPARITGKGWASYLTWDLRDKQGQRVGQGVYLWRVNLVFDDGSQRTDIIRTGVLRGPL